MTVTDDSHSILTHTIQMTHRLLTKRFEPSVDKSDCLTKLSLKLDLVSNLSSRDLIIPKRSLRGSHSPFSLSPSVLVIAKHSLEM